MKLVRDLEFSFSLLFMLRHFWETQPVLSLQTWQHETIINWSGIQALAENKQIRISDLALVGEQYTSER